MMCSWDDIREHDWLLVIQIIARCVYDTLSAEVVMAAFVL